MTAPGDLDVASYTDFAATFYRAVTAGGTTYSVIVAGEAGVALVQQEGCRGWAEVPLCNLGLDEAPGLQLAAAAIDMARVR